MSRHAVVLTVVDTGGERVVVADVDDETTVGELADALGVASDAALTSVDGVLARDATLIDAGVRSGHALGVDRAVHVDWKQLGPELRVIGGIGAGLRRRLDGEVHTLGRAADIVIGGERVSRHHAELQWTGQGFRVRDLGSRHGTQIEGEPAPSHEWVDCAPGTAVRLADTVFTVVAATEATTVRRHGGPFHAAHVGGRMDSRPPTPTHVVPAPPMRNERRSFAPLVIPSAGAVALAAAAGGAPPPLALAATPAAVVVGLLADKGIAARSARRARRQHARKVEVACDDVRLAASALAHAARLRHPDPATLAAAAERRTSRLWATPADGLALRIGLSTENDAVAVTAPDADRDRLDDAATAHLVPATVALHEGPLIVAGTESQVDDLAQWLVMQAVGLAGPGDLDVVVLSDAPEDWAWVAATPHATRPAVVATTTDPAALPPRGAARRLVVLDRVETPTWFDERATRDCYVLWSTEHADAVPAFAANIVTATTDCDVEIDGVGGKRSGILADRLPTPEVTGAFAMSLAGLRGAVAASSGTATPNARELHPSLQSVEALIAAWDASPTAMRFAVGANADGPTTIELAGQNSHMLVAGTTGSGKTRLLETMAVSLAATFAPDALQFLVIDFKGGNELAALARLPHCGGIVSDRDPANVDRAIAALTREIARRDERFAAAGATDIDDYNRRATTPLGRVVVIADEFGQFRRDDAMGDRVGALLRVAAQGRSKGVHLVLATQSPSTDVTPEIRQNVGVRVCLRVAEAAESVAVLGSPDAAELRQPGDVLISADNFTRRARVALSRGPFSFARLPVVVDDLLAHATLPPRARQGDVELLDAIIDTVVAAADRVGAAATPLLTDALTDAVARNDLEGATRPWTVGGFVLAARDRPGVPDAPPFAFDAVRDATLTIVGGPGSGRSTTLLTVAAAARVQRDINHPVVVHTIDWTGDLVSLRGAAHDAGYVARGDVDHLRRTIHALATAASDPARVVVIDRLDALLRDIRELDNGALALALLDVIATGRARRVYAAFTIDPGALMTSQLSLGGRRLTLPIADGSMRVAAGLPRPVDMTPGRGVTDDGDEVQVGLPGDPVAAAPPAAHVAPMPAHVPVNRLGFVEGESCLLGIGGRGVVAPLRVDLDDAGPVIAVIGRRGSGRSTVLDAIAATYAGSRAVTRLDATTASSWQPTDAPTLLLVDDTTKAAAQHPWLTNPDLADQLRDGGHVMVAVFDQADLTSLGFSHWLTRRPCSGLLLALDATADRIVAGERVGFQPPAELRAGPAGRGWWCDRGTGTPVQVATT